MEGPRAVGKTTTVLQRAASRFDLDDPDVLDVLGVGLCDGFPLVSWLEPDREAAEAGIRAVVAETVEHLRARGKSVWLRGCRCSRRGPNVGLCGDLSG